MPTKPASDHIAEEVVIGADQPDRDRQHDQRIKRPQPGIQDPKHRDHGAGRRRVSGGERGVAGPAVKRVEAIGTVMDERRIVLHPGIRPQPSKDEFELALDRFSHNQADAAQNASLDDFRHRPPRQRPNPEGHERDNGERKQQIGNMGEADQSLPMRAVGMRQQSERPVDPLIADDDRRGGEQQGKKPSLYGGHRSGLKNPHARADATSNYRRPIGPANESVITAFRSDWPDRPRPEHVRRAV